MAGHYGLACIVGENVKCDLPRAVLFAQRQLKSGQIIEKSTFGVFDPPPEHDVAPQRSNGMVRVSEQDAQ